MGNSDINQSDRYDIDSVVTKILSVTDDTRCFSVVVLSVVTTEDIVACIYTPSVVKREGMIPFSGLSRFSGLFDGDGPSPLNRDTTVVMKMHIRNTSYLQV